MLTNEPLDTAMVSESEIEAKDTENMGRAQGEWVAESDENLEGEGGAEMETAVSLTAAEPGSSVEAGEVVPEREPGREKHKVQRRQPSRKLHVRRKKPFTPDEVVQHFAACDRCSYFLMGYLSAFGRQNVETAVYTIDADWLSLSWTAVTRTLVEKAYGTVIDIGEYYLESCCPNCRRPFVYWAETEEEQAGFQISM